MTLSGWGLRGRRRWLLASIAVVAAGIASVATPDRNAPARPAVQLAPVATLEPRGLPAGLPVRQTLPKARTDPFAARSWTPPAPPAPVQAAAPEAPPAPSAPPNPYRFAGTVHYAGSLGAVLIRNDRVHIVKAGEMLDGGYKLLSVKRNAATLLYTPLDIEQQMAFAPDPAPDRATATVQEQPGLQLPGAASSPFPPGSPLAAR
jgi:hypothetical protein